jgi:uncharacterized membrane protein YkvA (DUF1232 family)
MSEEREDDLVNTESTLATGVKEPGFWREIWQQLRLVIYLIRDPEVPIYLKLLPFAGIFYALFPFDLVTDFVPVIGQLDDVTALLVSSKVFIELAPQRVVARHMERIRERDGYSAFGEGVSTADPADDDLADAIVIDVEHELVLDNEPDDK